MIGWNLKSKFKVYKRGSDGIRKGRAVATFLTRKDAVYYCKVNQTLPLPNYEWEDEFEIVENVLLGKSNVKPVHQ